MNSYRTRKAAGYEQVLECRDPESGLDAVIVIHDTTLGPAVGGCRMRPYATAAEAFEDAARLARGMTYKVAAAGLPLGGGKAVIVGDPQRDKTPALLRAFGRAMAHLGGAFVTGKDVGTTVEDLAEVRKVTAHVAGLADTTGDPSLATARGVLHGVRAVVHRRFDGADLRGRTIAVQGLGSVGFELCRLLHAAGARLIVADIAAAPVERAVAAFGAAAVAPEAIMEAQADVFAPCALGGVLDDAAARRMKAGAVAGAANNQLADAGAGRTLHGRGILYAPDYVINAGGVINASWEVARRSETYDRAAALAAVAGIEDRLGAIFTRAAAQDTPPERVADEMVRERLARAAEAA